MGRLDDIVRRNQGQDPLAPEPGDGRGLLVLKIVTGLILLGLGIVVVVLRTRG